MVCRDHLEWGCNSLVLPTSIQLCVCRGISYFPPIPVSPNSCVRSAIVVITTSLSARSNETNYNATKTLQAINDLLRCYILIFCVILDLLNKMNNLIHIEEVV